MALTKKINVYLDSNDKYRRIHWDSWYVDDVFFGLSPVPMYGVLSQTSKISTAGVVTIYNDLIADGEGEDIDGILLQESEYAFLDGYDDVCFTYESDVSQTYEVDYNLDSRKL